MGVTVLLVALGLLTRRFRLHVPLQQVDSISRSGSGCVVSTSALLQRQSEWQVQEGQQGDGKEGRLIIWAAHLVGMPQWLAAQGRPCGGS